MKKKIYLIIILLITANLAFTQSSDSKSDKKVPVLNGHTFPSTGYFKSSFINTSLQANIGFGQTPKLKIPGIRFDNIEILDFEGQILFIDVNIRYQQRFTPWLALYFSMNMTGRVGTDMSTIVADGVNTLSGGSIGWLIRIKEFKKLNLSASVEVKKVTGTFINVAGYIEDLINNDPNPTIYKKIPATLIGVGFRGAYAFNQTFGLQLLAEFSYGEALHRSNDQGYFTGGVIGDVDFNSKYSFPLGLSLGYTLTTSPEIIMDEGGTSNLFTTKLNYTGSDDFELGLQFNYYNVKLKSVDGKPYIKKVLLALKFYF